MTRRTAPPAPTAASAYAHRGVHVTTTRGVDGVDGAAPGENTAAAVTAAAALGYRWVETDVRATADGEVVLAHDADLARVTGLDPGRAVVAEHTLADLTAVAAGAGYDVTTLERACDAAPDVELNIDVKAPAAVPGLVALAARRPELVRRWRVTSFSERTRSAAVRRLLALRDVTRVRTSASAPLAALCVGIARAPLPRRVRGALLAAVRRATGLDALQLPPTATAALPERLVEVLGAPGTRLQLALTDVRVIDAALLDAAHRAAVAVHAWTVDDPAQMRELLDAGVDGLVTDAPLTLADVLRARGEPWPQGTAARP